MQGTKRFMKHDTSKLMHCPAGVSGGECQVFFIVLTSDGSEAVRRGFVVIAED